MAEHDIPIVLGILKAVMVVFVIVGIGFVVAKNLRIF